MSEYDVLINKYNALNAGYDQLYPKPMKHANTHAKDGNDPITPSMIGTYTQTQIDTALQNKENSFSVLPINKGGTGANNIKTARANLGIDKNISCPAGGSITLTLPQDNIFLIGTSDNIRSSGLILVYTRSLNTQNNVSRVVQLDTLRNWSYSLSGGVLTLSETNGQYPADFSVVTLCCGTYSEVYS